MTTAESAQLETTTITDVDKPATDELDAGWEHQFIEYRGDRLAVRYAKLQALMAYQLSSGKYIDMEKQNDASGLFITQHFGPDSYDRIMERMIDPDDPDYDMKSFAEIMGILVRESVTAVREAREADAAKKLESKASTSG